MPVCSRIRNTLLPTSWFRQVDFETTILAETPSPVENSQPRSDAEDRLRLFLLRPAGHVGQQPVGGDGDRQPEQPGCSCWPETAGDPGVDQHLPSVLWDVHDIQEVRSRTHTRATSHVTSELCCRWTVEIFQMLSPCRVVQEEQQRLPAAQVLHETSDAPAGHAGTDGVHSFSHARLLVGILKTSLRRPTRSSG